MPVPDQSIAIVTIALAGVVAFLLGARIIMRARLGDQAGIARLAYAMFIVLALAAVIAALPAGIIPGAHAAFRALSTLEIPDQAAISAGVSLLVTIMIVELNQALRWLAWQIAIACTPGGAPRLSRALQRPTGSCLEVSESCDYAVLHHRGKYDVYHTPTHTWLSNAMPAGSPTRHGWNSIEAAEAVMNAVDERDALGGDIATASRRDHRHALRALAESVAN